MVSVFDSFIVGFIIGAALSAFVVIMIISTCVTKILGGKHDKRR